MEAPAPTLMEASTACVQLASWGTFVTLISMSVRAIHVRMEAPAPTLMEASLHVFTGYTGDVCLDDVKNA